MRTPRVIVIGAGIGGLSAALELTAAGCDVRVLEAQPEIGGKLRQITFAGNAGIDSGPTVFTMRWVFDALFDRLGLNLDDHLKLEKLDLLARHSWARGGTLDLYADLARSTDAIAAFSSPAEAQRFRDFAATAQRIYETLENTFMAATQPNVFQLTGRIALENPFRLTAIHPFRTLWAELDRYFHDPRLRQLFARYATYCGSSPFLAPGTLMLIAHAEARGVWLIKGGMRQLALTFAKLATDQGATIRCNAPVAEILQTGGVIAGVRLADGEILDADALVFNGDANALSQSLLRHTSRADGFATPRKARSLSALTWSMLASADGYDLAPHTVFFGANYSGEFNDILDQDRLPAQPTVYVHAPDRPVDGAPNSDQSERLFCLVNAPAYGDRRDDNPEELDQCQASMLRLMRQCGLKLRWRPEHCVRTTPAMFDQLFPQTGGALYGRASHGWRSSFQRPANRTRITGLYLAGGSAHPGPGVPMAALSGRLAANCLVRDLRSTHRLHPAATIGGTSTA